MQEKARQEKLEEKKAADNRRLSALQEARDAAAAAAQTRAELSAKTEEERKMRAEKAKEVRSSSTLHKQQCQIPEHHSNEARVMLLHLYKGSK